METKSLRNRMERNPEPEMYFSTLLCPVCRGDNLHQVAVEIYNQHCDGEGDYSANSNQIRKILTMEEA